MGIEMLACLARLQLALLPVNPVMGSNDHDGDWEGAIAQLPIVLATSINLLPTEYQGRAIEAVRQALKRYQS